MVKLSILDSFKVLDVEEVEDLPESGPVSKKMAWDWTGCDDVRRSRWLVGWI